MTYKLKLSVSLALFLFFFCSTTTAQDLSDAIEWTGTIELEEQMEGEGGVYTMWPVPRIDPEGGFLVIDAPEHQARLYDESGRLKHYFGRAGQGPGEFQRPVSALRESSGNILVADAQGTVQRFDPTGTFLERTERILNGIYQLHSLSGESALLAVGTQEGLVPGQHPLLHRVDMTSERVVESFFPHPIALGSHENVLFGLGDPAAADVYEGQIVAAFAPVDRLYFFDLEGTEVDSLSLPSEHFRRIEKPDFEDPSDRRRHTQYIEEHSTTFSRIDSVFWLNEDILLVSYFDLLERDPWTVKYNVMAVARSGELLFDVADAPRLLTVNPDTQELIFSDPDYEVENRWRVGQIRNAVLDEHGL